jgi:hypothetical protein
LIPENAISITDYGAVADGRDNWSSIQQAFDAGQTQGRPVYVPVGQWHYSTELKLNGVKVYGEGEQSVLVGTTRTNMALIMKFDRPGVYNLKIIGPVGIRWTAWEACGISVLQATNFEIRGVLIERCGAAGIHVDGSSGGLIEYNTLRWTGADSIHMSCYLGACFDIMVRHNRSENSRDDGVAVVSEVGYPMSHHITIEHNTVVEQEGGRGFTVAGGQHVTIRNNHYDNNKASFAGIYVSSEPAWLTHGSSYVWVEDNTVKNAGGNHGSIHVYAGNGPVNQIYIKRNQIYASRNAPVVTNGSIQGTDIFVADNVCYGPHQNFVNMNDGTVAIQSNNTFFSLLDYPGDEIKPGEGVQELQQVGVTMVNTTAARSILVTNINDNSTRDITAADVRGVFNATFDALDTAGTSGDGKGQITGTIAAPTNRTYTVDLSAPYSYQIDSLVTQTTAGTCTLAVQVSGINVAGLNAVAVSTTQATSLASGSRSVAGNAKVTFVVSAVSGASDLVYALRYTRT